MDRIDTRLRKIFAELFRADPEALDDGTRRGELDGWDSLGHLDLVSALEQEFEISLDPDEALEIETFGDAKRVLAATLGHG